LGPCFDGGIASDLSALDNPFNSDGHWYSWANKPRYRISVDGAGTNMLTNNKDNNFTITELEVWEVTYLE
jgi:hypothetical protein